VDAAKSALLPHAVGEGDREAVEGKRQSTGADGKGVDLAKCKANAPLAIGPSPQALTRFCSTAAARMAFCSFSNARTSI
jgi:hypothetical protein